MINLYHCDCVCVAQPNFLLLWVVYVCGDHCTIITQACALHHLLVDKTRIRHAKQKVPRCCMHLHKRTQEQQGLSKEKERCLWIHFKVCIFRNTQARIHLFSAHIHPHSMLGHVIMSITSCLSGTICPLIKPHTMWITVQSPCLAQLHSTLPRVKTPWLKLHLLLFIYPPLLILRCLAFYFTKKEFYSLHVCVRFCRFFNIFMLR